MKVLNVSSISQFYHMLSTGFCIPQMENKKFNPLIGERDMKFELYLDDFLGIF